MIEQSKNLLKIYRNAYMLDGEELKAVLESFAALVKKVDQLSSEKNEKQWFSTQEKLPKEETPVLIILHGKVRLGELRWDNPAHEDTYKSFMYFDDPNDDGQSWDVQDVTHWMPIPATSHLFDDSFANANIKPVLEKTLETLEFLWRDVPMNDFAFEKLESEITSISTLLATQD